MSFTRFRERSRDVQDGTERHVWGKQEYIKSAGSIIKVRGTDTEDEEAAVLVIGGVSFNVKEKFNTEVMLLASSSDTQLKMALLTIPKDKQRRWMEGHGGVQHPTDDEFALDFSDKIAHLTKNKFGVGENGEFEVKGKESYFRVDKLIVTGELIVNKRVKTPEVVQGSEDPPKFEGAKQAEAKDDDSGSQPTQIEMDI
ncbi:hypothetical protein [Bradyrhizobium sp. USDA 10063]